MKTIWKALIILLTGVISIFSGNAQGTRCENIEPFCAGQQKLTFPNANYQNSNQISGELGPDYGCLNNQPYPAWFFLQIENTGDLRFRISQSVNSDGSGAPLDVDFVVWGPFSRGDDYCSGTSLKASNIIDCSYLRDTEEFMSIPDAQENEIYVVVITNFEEVPGYISLEQTNTNGGSTDCSILNFDLGDNISVCDADEYILDGTTDEAATYEWFLRNESTGQFELIPNENEPLYTVKISGDYRLVVTDKIEDKSEQDEVTVTFYDSPLIGVVEELAACSLDASVIDLLEATDELMEVNGDTSDLEVLYYESLQDTENMNPISSPQSYAFSDGKTIYARVRDKISGCFSVSTSFELTTFDFPDYQLPENTIFCVDLDTNILSPVTLGQDLGDGYFYEWYDGNNLVSTSSLVTFETFPSASGIKLIVSHAESGCELEFITNPVAVSRPETVSILISGSDFGDGYRVEANPENIIGAEFSEFEYRIDNGDWQDSNVFSGVTPGNHSITAREINGCGSTTSESFFLVGYPRFFSPNSDGYNDTWNLITDDKISIKKLYVFDRYGKLIKVLDPEVGKGWDGTYNGQALPANDYWFRVEFIDEKTGEHREYMSNFTLLR